MKLHTVHDTVVVRHIVELGMFTEIYDHLTRNDQQFWWDQLICHATQGSTLDT